MDELYVHLGLDGVRCDHEGFEIVTNPAVLREFGPQGALECLRCGRKWAVASVLQPK